jgi:hypothetical protein
MYGVAIIFFRIWKAGRKPMETSLNKDFLAKVEAIQRRSMAYRK